MTHIKGLDHSCFQTGNLEEIENFYCGVLGLDLSFSFRNEADEKYGVFIDTPNGTRLEFFQGAARPHIAFEVDDVYKQAEKLRELGYKVGEIKRGKKDKVLQFFMEDPQGNLIEFQQFDEESIR